MSIIESLAELNQELSSSNAGIEEIESRIAELVGPFTDKLSIRYQSGETGTTIICKIYRKLIGSFSTLCDMLSHEKSHIYDLFYVASPLCGIIECCPAYMRREDLLPIFEGTIIVLGKVIQAETHKLEEQNSHILLRILNKVVVAINRFRIKSFREIYLSPELLSGCISGLQGLIKDVTTTSDIAPAHISAATSLLRSLLPLVEADPNISLSLRPILKEIRAKQELNELYPIVSQLLSVLRPSRLDLQTVGYFASP